MAELTLEQQIAERDAQNTAFRHEALSVALDAADKSLSEFIDAMNKVVRNFGGKLPDNVHDAFDRILLKQPTDQATLVKWLKSQLQPEPADESGSDNAPPGDGTNPETPQPPSDNDKNDSNQ